MPHARLPSRRLSTLAPALLGLILLTACGAVNPDAAAPQTRAAVAPAVDPVREEAALQLATETRAKGQRLWCVPFARALSGVTIKGDAKTWWSQAQGVYDRGMEPQAGAVMAFQATKKMPKGHVAVVSQVLSEREILIDHANWDKNKVSLKMAVMDVSKNNDWTAVRLESLPGTFGRVYPINGFIYPKG